MTAGRCGPGRLIAIKEGPGMMPVQLSNLSLAAPTPWGRSPRRDSLVGQVKVLLDACPTLFVLAPFLLMHGVNDGFCHADGSSYQSSGGRAGR
jgi:hypothetical protein